jgi:hypothetical protein
MTSWDEVTEMGEKMQVILVTLIRYPNASEAPRASARGILAKASDSMFHLFKIKASTPIIYDQS